MNQLPKRTVVIFNWALCNNHLVGEVNDPTRGFNGAITTGVIENLDPVKMLAETKNTIYQLDPNTYVGRTDLNEYSKKFEV